MVLGPHASAVVILRPPMFTGAPSHGSYWMVAGVHLVAGRAQQLTRSSTGSLGKIK